MYLSESTPELKSFTHTINQNLTAVSMACKNMCYKTKKGTTNFLVIAIVCTFTTAVSMTEQQ